MSEKIAALLERISFELNIGEKMNKYRCREKGISIEEIFMKDEQSIFEDFIEKLEKILV